MLLSIHGHTSAHVTTYPMKVVATILLLTNTFPHTYILTFLSLTYGFKPGLYKPMKYERMKDMNYEI